MNSKRTGATMVAADVMVRRDKLVVLSPKTDIDDAIEVLLRSRISGAPVVEDGRLVGILSERDCLKLLANTAMYDWPSGGAAVRDFMSTELTTVGPDDPLISVAGLFLSNRFRRLPVLDGDELVGQISRRDVLRGIQRARTPTSEFPDYRAPEN